MQGERVNQRREGRLRVGRQGGKPQDGEPQGGEPQGVKPQGVKPEDVKSRGGKQRGAAVRPPVFDGHDHLDDPKARLAVAGLAVTVAVFVMLATAYEGGADALDYALVAVGSLALAAFGRVPRIVLAVTTACMVAFVLHAEPTTAAAFPVLGAVHIAAHGRHRLLAAGTGLAFLGAFFAADPGGDGAVERTLLLTGWFVCAAAMGVAAKTWQAYVHQTEERALEAERTREEAALRRAGEERLRIARELHDSLTHSISIVKLQAGVAVHLARKRGEEVPPALLAIQEASGEAMRELRATLEVLRTDAPAGSPALLVERARSAGLPVELTVTGRERALPPELELGVYRIVQESLTNAARHAVGAESVGVHLDYGERQVVVRVDDDGVARPGGALAHGVGLTGMRERVEALGGALRAGARDEGGFSVRAELPVDSPGAPVEAQGAWETQG